MSNFNQFEQDINMYLLQLNLCIKDIFKKLF